jgi:DNA-binding transcriptional MerR regulator
MSATLHYRIGEAAKRSGVSSANIRYYEKEGLLSPGGRSDNQYRFYNEADLHRLRFIRLCRAMDMSLGEVRALLAIDATAKAGDHQACTTVDAHLEHVRLRLQELRTLELELQALRGRCDGTDAHCHVIEALHARADAQDMVLQRNAPAHRHV